MEYPGNLFVVAAPSGAGKSSLVKALMELDQRVSPSISHTTREPRGQEVHGREYYFVSRETFDQIDARSAQLVAHRRIDIGVAAGDFVAGSDGQLCDPAHEGAADTQNMNVHVAESR